MRVVSLLPSATEIVAALGGMEHLVGVSHACDYPPMVDSRVRVTTTAVDANADARAVDDQVRSIAASGGPLYTLLEDRIRALRPDVVITQALCEVCAVMETDVRALAARLEPVPRVVTLSATTLDGVFADIATVGEVLGLADEAEELVAGAHARMRAVHETLKRARAPRPRVAVIEWGEPIYTAGHWMPEMVRRAGGVVPASLANDGAVTGDRDNRGSGQGHSVVIAPERLRAADPEVIVIAPCGYDLARSAAEARRLLALEDWAWARGRRVWAIDANAFASRPGPRLVDGIEVLARCFNPSLFTPLDPGFAVAL
ncbi:MAG TPA: ABC transporter substrate-binding protein [Gemmatimonadaceae bacterium]|nr:ABC transporter substrate-binding protein [Gemmatimonadaceae bacterium]